LNMHKMRFLGIWLTIFWLANMTSYLSNDTAYEDAYHFDATCVKPCVFQVCDDGGSRA